LNKKRKKISIQGIVQGVGFRPFVYRLAQNENLKGFVSNTSQGVEIEVEGGPEALERFIRRLHSDPPPLAKITEIEVADIQIRGEVEFLIRSSREVESRSTLISPDISICADCLLELFDPEDRRYRYPFINCTNCGPRYTIIQDIPYDRPKTTMSSFNMCQDCQNEYYDPSNRRFHAQPNACSVCGPKIWLTDRWDCQIDSRDPIGEVVRSLKDGKIIAIKGLGGFHLACDAANESAVSLLRRRKGREEKPLAVMALDIPAVEKFAKMSVQERDLLLSSRRPIILLQKKRDNSLAESVAPRNNTFGTMLPYTPLHYLILKQGFDALVMTSGNISEEPIAIGNREAQQRLGGIADIFLMHDRDIYLRSDDSVTRFISGLPRIIRRSRGIVPMPVFLRRKAPSILAVGGELKNTICLFKDDRAFLSQHIGDLENMETLAFFEECVHHLTRILQVEPVAIAHDLHPDYLSTQWALEQKEIPRIGVQHHHAHIAACLAENGREDQVIGIALDGTGYGDDGHIWGGEILIADLVSYERIGHFDYFPMPGGPVAIKEPWRMGIVYLYKIYKKFEQDEKDGEDFIRWMNRVPFFEKVDREKIKIILQMIEKGVNVPKTSSLGRLFDGVAAIIGLRETVTFEGQAAMELEMAMGNGARNGKIEEGYSFETLDREGNILISPDMAVRQVVEDITSGISPGEISLKFHIGLIGLFLSISEKIRDGEGNNVVALSGGCFQNRFLLENLSSVLEKAGFEVLTHSQVPSNDGGLALGQAVVASYQF